MASRWSQVFGVPLAALGVVVYVGLYGALLWRTEALAGFCLAAIGSAALWLVTVQLLLMGRICPWCMAAHGVGLVMIGVGLGVFEWEREFRNGVQAGATMLVVLALAQVYGPVPQGHRIADEGEVMPAAIHERGNGRKVAFDGGRKTYDVSSLPRMGRVDASHVLVEYFDFQCSACRTMRGYLEALVEKYPAGVCVILLPVPLEEGCNKAMSPGEAGHPGSCALARIALAVWRVKPDAYQAVHLRFMETPALDEATALSFARSATAGAPVDEAMRDPWVGELVAANVADWVALSNKTIQLPKLMIRDKRILHGLPSGEEDFIRVMEKELGL